MARAPTSAPMVATTAPKRKATPWRWGYWRGARRSAGERAQEPHPGEAEHGGGHPATGRSPLGSHQVPDHRGDDEEDEDEGQGGDALGVGGHHGGHGGHQAEQGGRVGCPLAARRRSTRPRPGRRPRWRGPGWRRCRARSTATATRAKPTPVAMATGTLRPVASPGSPRARTVRRGTGGGEATAADGAAWSRGARRGDELIEATPRSPLEPPGPTPTAPRAGSSGRSATVRARSRRRPLRSHRFRRVGARASCRSPLSVGRRPAAVEVVEFPGLALLERGLLERTHAGRRRRPAATGRRCCRPTRGCARARPGRCRPPRTTASRCRPPRCAGRARRGPVRWAGRSSAACRGQRRWARAGRRRRGRAGHHRCDPTARSGPLPRPGAPRGSSATGSRSRDRRRRGRRSARSGPRRLRTRGVPGAGDVAGRGALVGGLTWTATDPPVRRR